MGWGLTPWGAGQWGLGGAETLQLLQALAIRDNVVRLWFNEAPIFTGVLDPHDASSADRYVIVPIAGTMIDHTNPRPVTPIIIERVAEPLALGRILDVTVDRHFDGYPGSYRISVNRLVSAESGVWLDPVMASIEFYGAEQVDILRARDLAMPTRDIANPQTLAALLDPLPVTTVGTLGSIPTNIDGDYAYDEGITGYKKRLWRRITSRKNRFAHLPGYGVGLPSKLKQLGKSSVRFALAADIRSQVLEEPESIAASVSIIPDPNAAGLYRIRMRVQSTISNDPINIDEPFVING